MKPIWSGVSFAIGSIQIPAQYFPKLLEQKGNLHHFVPKVMRMDCHSLKMTNRSTAEAPGGRENLL